MTITISSLEADFLDIESSIEGLKQNLEELLAYGVSSGADLVEIFLEHVDNLGVLAEQDLITSVSPSFGRGVGLRVFSNGKDGFVSTNDLSRKGLKTALDQALSMLGLEATSLNNSRFIGLKELSVYGPIKSDLYLKCPGLKEATHKILEGTSMLNKLGKHLEVRRGTYSKSIQEVFVAASDGTFGRDLRLYQSIGLNALAVDKQYRSSLGRRYGSTGNPSQLSEWDVEDSARDISESAQKNAICQICRCRPNASSSCE